MEYSVYIVWPSVLILNNFKLLQEPMTQNAEKNICIQAKFYFNQLTFNPGVVLTRFWTIWPWFQQNDLTWARDLIINQHFVSDQLKRHMTLISSKPEPLIWSHDTGQQIPWFDRCQSTITWMSNIKDICCKPRLHDLILTELWPLGWPCCATLLSFIVIRHT